MSKMSLEPKVELNFELANGAKSILLLPLACNTFEGILASLGEMQEMIILEKVKAKEIEAIKKAEAAELEKNAKAEELAKILKDPVEVIEEVPMEKAEKVEEEISSPVV